MPKITLVTCREFASPIAPDDALLMDALRARGVEVERVAWEDPYPWNQTDVAVVRSTWNSHLFPVAYLAWARQVARRTRLLNPLAALQWNMNKYAYFQDLECLGVLTPTLFLKRGTVVDLPQLAQRVGWNRLVLKPNIGANAFQVLQVDPADPASLARGQDHASRVLTHHDLLVQRYLSSVEQQGEHSHVFLGGAWSHAFRKLPFYTRPAGTPPPEQQIVPHGEEVTRAQRIAMAVEQLLGGEPLAYLRVDLARDETGRLRLMEVEANEPLLHLEYGDAAARLADVLVAALPQTQLRKWPSFPCGTHAMVL